MVGRLPSVPRLPAVMALALFGACGIFGRGPTADELAEAHAARLLTDLIETVTGDLEISGERIAAAAKESSIDRLSVHYRMRLSRAARTSLGYRDPRVGLLDLWALCLQAEQYLAEGDGADVFGPHQAVAVESVRRSLAHVSERATKVFRGKEATAAVREVSSFARQHPMRDLFARTGLLETDIRLGPDGSHFSLMRTLRFDWINPLSGFGSDVNESAEAVGAAMDRFTIVAEFLPRQIGWQLELFVYDLEAAEGVQDVARGATRVAAGVEGVALLAENLPTRLREELTTALRAVDPTLDNIRRTLAEVRASAEPVGEVGARWAGAAQQVDAMARGLTQALTKFDGTFRMLTNDGDDDGNGNGDEAAADPGRPFDILDWNQTAQSIRQMSEELQLTLDGLQHTVGDPALPGALDKAKEAAGETVATATLAVVLGGAALIALVVVAAWLLRVLRPGRSASGPRT